MWDSRYRMVIEGPVCWDMALCSRVNRCRHFKGVHGFFLRITEIIEGGLLNSGRRRHNFPSKPGDLLTPLHIRTSKKTTFNNHFGFISKLLWKISSNHYFCYIRYIHESYIFPKLTKLITDLGLFFTKYNFINIKRHLVHTFLNIIYSLRSRNSVDKKQKNESILDVTMSVLYVWTQNYGRTQTTLATLCMSRDSHKNI